jgi:zinc/manganese transport system substrate-binding protein
MFLIIGLSALAAAAALPTSTQTAPADRPVVITTTSIWADITDEIDCADRFDLATLISIGGDAHSYEPSMRDREAMANADLVVANGGGLEEELDDTLHVVADEGTPLLEVFDHVSTTPLDDHDDEGDHEHPGNDPHIWFDPTLVMEAATVIGDSLVDAGADGAEIADCVAAYTETLVALDREVADILSVVPSAQRLLVTNHDSLGYFARHFDFEILGSVLPGSSTLSEASPAELADLSDEIEEAGVPAIFAEELESADEATALADRLGVDVVTLYTDSLGEQGTGAETYVDLMRYDATAIADALS